MDKLILILLITSMIFAILTIMTIFFNTVIGVCLFMCFAISLAIINIVAMIDIFKDLRWINEIGSRYVC